MRNSISSDLSDYLQTLDPMIVFVIATIIIKAVAEKFVV
jgi:hypothetical protein